MFLDVVEVLSAGEQVALVCTRRGWYVVGAIPDARQDRLEDLPVLAGPFLDPEAGRAWWQEKDR